MSKAAWTWWVEDVQGGALNRRRKRDLSMQRAADPNSLIFIVCVQRDSAAELHVLALSFGVADSAGLPGTNPRRRLPFGPGKPWLTHGVAGALARGWQIQGLLTMYTGQPFSVSADSTSLNAPGNSQRANQVKSSVAILGGGPNQSWFDPLAFAPVTTATFGTAGFDSIFGPGAINLDAGLVREFQVTERWRMQFRADAFNATNTPHFSNPSANVSNMILNGDGTIKSLGGYSTITSAKGGFGREGIDERMLRLGVRIRF